MPHDPALSALPTDGPALAFVLRLRGSGSRTQDRLVIQIDDVQTDEVWRETSLERAFERIRLAVGQHLNLQPGSQDLPRKPN